MQNIFFTKEEYENEINLETNEDVLNNIYADNVQQTDKLPIGFYFVTNTEEKAKAFEKYLKEKFVNYSNISVQLYNENFEVNGLTEPITMTLSSINYWNKLMWDVGYKFDCKLDGWEVEVS